MTVLPSSTGWSATGLSAYRRLTQPLSVMERAYTMISNLVRHLHYRTPNNHEGPGSTVFAERHSAFPPFHPSKILQVQHLSPSQFPRSVFCKFVACTSSCTAALLVVGARLTVPAPRECRTPHQGNDPDQACAEQRLPKTADRHRSNQTNRQTGTSRCRFCRVPGRIGEVPKDSRSRHARRNLLEEFQPFSA